MNDHDNTSELPELSDDAIRLLYRICEIATEAPEPPFKALFAAYDRVLDEQNVEQEHDAVLFRYLMRVGQTTRLANQQGRDVDLVRRLRSVLEAQGITLLDGGGDETQTFELQSSDIGPTKNRHRRRVSFDDARIEKRWLSEHSESMLLNEENKLLSQAPRRPRHAYHGRRTRSASSYDLPTGLQRDGQLVQRDAPSVQDPTPKDEPNFNNTLLFELSQTQLEQNAEAFLATSELRSARRFLHTWHEAAAQLGQARESANIEAGAHDRKTLLRQAWEQWRSTLQEALVEKRRREELARQEKRAVRERNKMLARKVLDFWFRASKKLARDNQIAKEYILMVRYFLRWKRLAVDNQLKLRSILSRKFLVVWRDKTARASLRNEQAIAHYEGHLMMKYKMIWFWKLCENRVQTRHDNWVLRQALNSLVSRFNHQRQLQLQADHFHRPLITSHALRALEEEAQLCQERQLAAERHYRHHLVSRCFFILRNQARLEPLAKETARTSNENRKRQAFDIWRLQASLSGQAAAVSTRRVLQNAWTSWNDALRCKALTQRVDERVLLETLYKWVLMERLRLFQRTMKDRLAAKALTTLRSRAGEAVDRLQFAERVFAEAQQRRRLAFGVRQLNLSMRKREDAERAAVEFAIGHECPKYFKIWKGQSDHARRLTKWAADARYYFVCSSTLQVWKKAADEHRHNRKREAYAHLRAELKLRLARRCFGRWRERTNEVHAMNTEAQRIARVRIERLAAQAFDSWRENANRIAGLEAQAVLNDQHKLLASALGIFRLQQAQQAQLEQQASDFRHDTDLAVLEATLKRMQWMQFTAARRLESADALRARNRDAHIKNMLRHWASRMASRRTHVRPAGTDAEAEPESPSLRPASRAATRSAEKAPASSPPALPVAGTPAYMRTPSRNHRRAGRFRPLPTPAPATPMAFDPAYLVTNPAPTVNLSGNLPQSAAVGLTPQITPFARKLRAGGLTPGGPPGSSFFGRTGVGTNKSVRFGTTSRFGGGRSSAGRSKES